MNLGKYTHKAEGADYGSEFPNTLQSGYNMKKLQYFYKILKCAMIDIVSNHFCT